MEVAAKNHREKIVRRKDSWQLYLMLIPAVLVVLIFVYMPMGGLVMAFQDYKPYQGILKSEWVGLEQFKFLFEYPDSVQVIWNTLRIAMLKLFFGFISTLGFALLINEVRRKALRNTVQTFVFLPHFLSWVVLGGIFVELLNPDNGLVNLALQAMGMKPIFFWVIITGSSLQ